MPKELWLRRRNWKWHLVTSGQYSLNWIDEQIRRFDGWIGFACGLSIHAPQDVGIIQNDGAPLGKDVCAICYRIWPNQPK